MGKKFVLYTLLTTGIVVTLVGIQNLFVFWGEVSFYGMIGQLTGGILILGGIVNLWVASKFRTQVSVQRDRNSES
jgi:hypothetical protein